MLYFKRIKAGKVVGMGYLGDNDTLFQMFKEESEYEQVRIEMEEFMELGKKHDFEGMKPYNQVLPSSHF